jgi:hypothetical protein
LDPFDPTIAHTDAPSTSASPAETESEPPHRFPWPPAEGESILTAFTDTCYQCLFKPATFFRAMPSHGHGSALAFYLPIAIVSAAFSLLWSSVFDAVGIDDLLRRWLGQEASVTTATERLLGFLFTPITALAALFIGSALVHVSLKVLGGARKPLQTTTRVFAFSSTPQLFTIIPVLGTITAVIWGLVLAVIGVREAHQTSTGRAIAAVFLPVFVLLIMAVGLFVLLIMLGAMLGLDPG